MHRLEKNVHYNKKNVGLLYLEHFKKNDQGIVSKSLIHLSKRSNGKDERKKERKKNCCNGISHTPSQSCGVTIYTVGMALGLSLLRGLVACLTIPCLSYCISLAIKAFLLFDERVDCCCFFFHSSTTLSDCIPFKEKKTLTYFYAEEQNKDEMIIVKRGERWRSYKQVKKDL